jgi:DNA repair exonuclease SbcCD nuclease subunit
VRVAAIGDTHFPWVDRPRLDRALAIIKDFRPDAVVQMGDVFDLYSWSKYARTYDLMTPREELISARSGAEAMWHMIQVNTPGVRCYQLLGNHDDRLFKTVYGKLPELEAVLNYLDVSSLWRFDGVDTQADGRDELELGGNIFIHGYRTRLGDHLNYFGRNVVCGHSHKAGVVYRRYHGETRWEMNVGFIAQPDSPVMQYTSTKTADTTPALGLIDDLGPRVVPL